MAKNRTTSSFLLSVSAAFVAGWLLLVTNGDVFVSPVPTSGVRATVPSWQAKQVATLATATGSGTSVAPDQRLFKTAAAAALLCLAAARLTKGRFQKPSVARRAVVTLKATTEKNLHEFEEPVAPIFTETHVVQEAQSIPMLPELISLNETPSLAVLNCVDSQTVAAAATAVAPAATTSACLCGSLASARFAAGTRHAQHRRRTSRRASKASRRAVGRHLCERVVTVSSPPCFDASKTRTKIQLGLRVSSCMRSESGRESKLSSGVVCSKSAETGNPQESDECASAEGLRAKDPDALKEAQMPVRSFRSSERLGLLSVLLQALFQSQDALQSLSISEEEIRQEVIRLASDLRAEPLKRPTRMAFLGIQLYLLICRSSHARRQYAILELPVLEAERRTVAFLLSTSTSQHCVLLQAMAQDVHSWLLWQSQAFAKQAPKLPKEEMRKRRSQKSRASRPPLEEPKASENREEVSRTPDEGVFFRQYEATCNVGSDRDAGAQDEGSLDGSLAAGGCLCCMPAGLELRQHEMVGSSALMALALVGRLAGYLLYWRHVLIHQLSLDWTKSVGRDAPQRRSWQGHLQQIKSTKLAYKSNQDFGLVLILMADAGQKLSLPTVSDTDGADELEAWLCESQSSLLSCHTVDAAGRQLGDQAFSRFVASLLSTSVQFARSSANLAPGGCGIQYMDLSGNCLTDTAAVALAECLTWMRESLGGHMLRSLRLSSNNIGPAGAQALALSFLPQNASDASSPYRLALSENPLGDEGVTLVADAVRRRRSAAVLELSSVGCGAAGCRSLIESLEWLRGLDLCENSIPDDELGNLAARLPESHDFRLPPLNTGSALADAIHPRPLQSGCADTGMKQVCATAVKPNEAPWSAGALRSQGSRAEAVLQRARKALGSPGQTAASRPLVLSCDPGGPGVAAGADRIGVGARACGAAVVSRGHQQALEANQRTRLSSKTSTTAQAVLDRARSVLQRKPGEGQPALLVAPTQQLAMGSQEPMFPGPSSASSASSGSSAPRGQGPVGAAGLEPPGRELLELQASQQEAPPSGSAPSSREEAMSYQRAAAGVSHLQKALRHLEGGLGMEQRERDEPVLRPCLDLSEPDAEALAMPERMVLMEGKVAEMQEDMRRLEHTVTSLQAEPEREDEIREDPASSEVSETDALVSESAEVTSTMTTVHPVTDLSGSVSPADQDMDLPQDRPVPSKKGGPPLPPKGKGKGKLGKGPPPPVPKADAQAGDQAGPPPPPGKGKSLGKGKGPKGGKGGPGAPPKGPPPKGAGPAKAPGKDPVPKAETKAPFLKKLYWKQVDIQDAEGTIFSEETRSRSNTCSAAIDFTALTRMLEAEQAKGSQLQRRSSGVLSKAQQRNIGTKVLSDHRARNIAIVLKRLPLSTKDLVLVLKKLEWENERIGTDDLEQILEVIPTQEEAKHLREHSSEEDCRKLRDVEQMVMPLALLTRASARVRVLCVARNARLQFKSTARALAKIRAACSAIQKSGMLRSVTMLALQLGNYINHGDSKKGAKAIAISSLMALKDFKVGEISSLHFLCASLLRSNPKLDAAQALLRELQPAERIAKMQVQGLSAALRTFARDLDTVKAECQNHLQEYEGEEGQSAEDEDGKELGDALDEVHAMTAAAEAVEFSPTSLQRQDEDATRWVEDVMKIRGGARRRLRCMRRIVEKLHQLLKVDMERTAEEVYSTLRFCGVLLQKPSSEALLARI
ncbi:FH14 [Symbiodinium microadriaticum]|nr:FH14 [Symbiodinium microadriaticum]